MNVQALRLANVRATISSEINDFLLRDLPDGLVDSLDVVRDVGNILNGTIVRNDHVLHAVVPEAEVYELAEKPGAHDLEFTSEYATGIDIAKI